MGWRGDKEEGDGRSQNGRWLAHVDFIHWGGRKGRRWFHSFSLHGTFLWKVLGSLVSSKKKRSYNLEQDLDNSMLFYKANSSFLCNWEKALSIYRVQPQNQDNFWHCIFPRQGITLSPSSTTYFPSPSVLIARPIPPLSLFRSNQRKREI